MQAELPQRKRLRLSGFDYGTDGAYFITICTHRRRCILSRVVGRGLAPAVADSVEYTAYGSIAAQQLRLLEERYPCVTVNRYVIMPNHIHMILIMDDGAAGASPRPTVSDVVCAYKSITTRECNKLRRTGKLFQTSFYDHVIRNQQDYDQIAEYIMMNPMRWQMDSLYTDE